MKADAQQIAIAEARGWTDCKLEWGYPIGTPPDGGVRRDVPKYPACLNAMHEAEKVLTREQTKTFALFLMTAVNYHPVGVVPDFDRDCRAVFGVAHATAAQRAEAFLRTIGKWEP